MREVKDRRTGRTKLVTPKGKSPTKRAIVKYRRRQMSLINRLKG